MQTQHIKEQLSEFTKIPVSRIEDEAHITDIVSDSFMLVEMLLVLQDHFEIELEHEDINDVVTVKQLINLVQEKISITHAVQTQP